jgi:hypothetical protein
MAGTFLFVGKIRQKCCSILVWITGCWNSLLASHHPKNNLCLSRIYGAWFGRKDHGLSTSRFKHMQTEIQTSRRLDYQIFKVKIKKPIAGDVLFKAYPMVPLSCRWYL